ncbi:hypothetical protein CGMCC3_g6443 [Colletotrichum fructicola]|nr:uncharacterized protein CGMCC3_g6443 [Colletotrichum fructicola]KAE9577522.1 hypothetical protein CGMCC3_g6443 [Colletotrichum fructicola]
MRGRTSGKPVELREAVGYDDPNDVVGGSKKQRSGNV